MAVLHPFSALRPVAELAPRIASVPYDVVSVGEARSLAEGNPLSFLHVVRPEIDLPEGIDEHDDLVYSAGAANLRDYAGSENVLREAEPSVYLYRLVMGGRAQTGIYACVSVDDYDSDVILKHEKTRPSKEDDRTRHILEQSAHAEPVMLTFRDQPAVSVLMAQDASSAPLYDFVAADGIRHTVWRVADPERYVRVFAGIDKLYVADGHHRCKAASRAAADRAADGAVTGPTDEARFFPAVLFPMGEMRIMAYNRVIRRLPQAESEFLRDVAARCTLQPNADPTPVDRGRVSLLSGSTWYGIELPASQRPGIAASLDSARLAEHILGPILGITDLRTDPNIDFVGGIRGTGALEDAVRTGSAALAFSMYPTSIEELVEVSDAGELMPPKSTWFEPKLRSGLLVHTF